MGTKKTRFAAALVIAGTAAQADTANGLVTTFANCAGRYSAEIEHAWLVGGGDPDMLEDRRDAFLTRLEGVTDAAWSVRALDLRIRAKHAHSRLLLHADFHTDPTVSSRARRLATMGIRLCHSALLG